MEPKYLTNFMMFTDLLIQTTQLVLLPVAANTRLCSSFSLYSHFEKIFLSLYVISVTLVENITAIRLSNKKNAGSTRRRRWKPCVPTVPRMACHACIKMHDVHQKCKMGHGFVVLYDHL